MSFSSASIKPFKNQNYDDLKSQHDESNLFEDPYFPTDSSSLYFTQMPPQGIIWQRPKEANPNAEFVSEGYGRCDMDQGYLGNCWFIAGAVGIMQCPKLFARVVPDDQGFGDGYAGIFHFRFWLYGEWVDVVIDDRLPYWPDGKLVFSSNKDQPNEYWSSLLEKAYAKVYGSYESLDAGQTYDALVDMSGGLQEQFELKKMTPDEKASLWNILYKGFKNDSIMGCSINADPSTREARLPNGLVRGHAYTITKIETYSGQKLLRIRNPWGNDVEWKGAWSDNSREWESLSESDRQDAGLVKKFDGEFWMSFEDFTRNWDSVQICHMTADSFSQELCETDCDSDLKWVCTTHQSAWIAGKNAGGCGNGDSAKFWKNPQFLIQLFDVDKDDNENMTTVIVALMQKDTRLKRHQKKSADSLEEFIQFKLFKIKDDVDVEQVKNTNSMLYATQLERIGASGPYINSREVTKRFRVSPGNYLIIPSTYDAEKSCEFMLRIFTEQEIETGTLDEKKDDLDDDDNHLDDIPEDKTFKHWKSFLNPKIVSHLKTLHDIGKNVFTINEGRIGVNMGNVGKLLQDKDGNINLHSVQDAFGNAQNAFKDFQNEFGKFKSFFQK
ncbi:unnamed protein product [Brachionus calyciflorus]|uniref:Calpain catalytic domain-containing protein n=1 Tax=Brachionus calyciflorus TaxID=104777 RepID=A0A813WRU1_9BILA|nr:unnamed protein product [Brachionus calyciflorus]